MKSSVAIAISALLISTSSSKLEESQPLNSLFDIPEASIFSADLQPSDPFVNTDITGSDDRFKTIKQLANQNGFRTEETTVTTEDGYILSVWRIPGNLKSENDDVKKPPVLLVAGLQADGMQWVWHRPDLAHAFILSKAGYDVWIVNNRGTHHSQTHTTLSNKDYAYWQWDWEEMGSKDLPATIDHIIATTGFESVSYIGHSQGTTQLLAGAALDPDYFNAKINLAVFYAPPFSIKNSTSASDRIASDPHVLPLIQKFIEGAHLYDWLPYGSFFAHTTSKACELLDGHLCKLVLNMFAGGDSKIDMNERLPVMLSYLPAGAGYRDSLHYGQLMHTEVEAFRRLDMGSKEANQKRYNQDTAPDYDLDAINFPLALFAGLKDVLADPTDVKWLQKQMGDKVVFADTQLPFDHLSFAFAREEYMTFFTKDTMSLLNHYNGKCDDSTLDSQFTIGNEKCLKQKIIQ